MIDFSDEYKTGIEILDHEHQAMISALMAASYSLFYNVEPTKLNTHFNVFLRMAKTHFFNEEEILERTNHPDKEMHKKEHQRLENELELLLNRKHEKLVEVVDKLEKWLIPHILEWDTKIKIVDKAYFTHAQL